MARFTTSRSLLVWATAAGVFAGATDVAQAQARRMRAMPSTMVLQARRGQPTPLRTPATEFHPNYVAPANNSHAATSANGNSGQAPIERRPPVQTQGHASQPGTGAASAGPARVEAPRQPAAAEHKDIPMMSANRNARGGGEHLSEWMNQHSNLNPGQQQQALEREPGFHELPAKTQQRLRDQLTQLNNMPPQQRARWVARTEAMERLTPDQRAQVRGAMQQLAALPPEQRGPVQRSFRQLRDLPPDQRGSAMNSERYGGQLNPAQRATLGNLMRVEPMLEPPEPKQQGGPR